MSIFALLIDAALAGGGLTWLHAARKHIRNTSKPPTRP